MGKRQLSYGNVHEENKLQDYTRKRGGLQFFSFLAVTKDSQADFSSDLFSFTRLLSLFYKGN